MIFKKKDNTGENINFLPSYIVSIIQGIAFYGYQLLILL